MGLSKQDKAFQLGKITYIDFKHIENERTLLNFFPLLKFDGYPNKIRNSKNILTIEAFLEEFISEENQDKFIGFAEHKDIVRKWLETDLLDLVNRGKPNQAVVSPRPLHGNTYKYKSSKHARDYGSSEHLFWMIFYSSKGQSVRDNLKDFIFAGLDQQTDRIVMSEKIDVETQAILHFDKQITRDTKDSSKEPAKYYPLCIGQSELLANDILRLLTYEKYMPRSVLVDYLKTLFSFHLGLYHLRLLKLLPALIKRAGNEPICKSCPMKANEISPHGDCQHRIGLVIDMGDPNNPHMRELAIKSAETHYRRIPNYIQAHFITKKLDELADNLKSRGKLSPAKEYFSISEILQLLNSSPANQKETEDFAKLRTTALIDRYKQGADTSLPPEIEQIINMKLGEFDTYIEILVAFQGTKLRELIVKCLDSFLLKNSDFGLLRQPSVRSPRFFVLGSRLLEVLLQIAVLELKGNNFVTREIRVDELLLFLRERYGIYIDRLPPGDGFGQPSITDQQALRKNVTGFKTRLREIGFFQDLSDAYITQTVTPRYTINQ
jgi:hypothetical protein